MLPYEEMKAAILASASLAELEDGKKPPVPKCGEDQNYVFISYAHADYRAVYCDLLELHRAGVRYWYDFGLPAGKDWDRVVEEKIKDANCAGVIFYLSESLFLSRSVMKEVLYTMGDGDGEGKNYFCVNLSGMQPSKILKQIIRSYDDEELERFGLDDRMTGLLTAFSDKATYIGKADAADTSHIGQTVKQIAEQFNVMAMTSMIEESERVRELREQLDFANTFSVKDGELLGYMGDAEEVTVPTGVNWIGMGAFRNCRSVRRVVFPAGVKGFSRSVFVRCINLESVEIPEGAILIGERAFEGCIRLSEVYLPDSMATVRDGAFSHCTSLARIRLPHALHKLESIFYDCERLTDIDYAGTRAEWEALEKESRWDEGLEDYTIHCTDGDIIGA